jgi:hypothetical protein
MPLTDDMLIRERRHLAGEGVQRLYQLPNGYGLSLVNSPVLHSYPFAWEAAVVTDMRDDGRFADLTYGTPLTSDVEIFYTDEEANDFIARAKAWALS